MSLTLRWYKMRPPMDKVIEAVKNMMLNDTGKEKIKEVNVR